MGPTVMAEAPGVEASAAGPAAGCDCSCAAEPAASPPSGTLPEGMAISSTGTVVAVSPAMAPSLAKGPKSGPQAAPAPASARKVRCGISAAACRLACIDSDNCWLVFCNVKHLRPLHAGVFLRTDGILAVCAAHGLTAVCQVICSLLDPAGDRLTQETCFLIPYVCKRATDYFDQR